MLSRAMQLRAVADLVACRPPADTLHLSDFEVPFDVCAQALLPLFACGRTPAPDETKQALLAALEGRADMESIVEAIKNAPGAGLREVPAFEDAVAGLPRMDELWLGMIPNGMVTLFGAGPGTGKTFVALDLARRVIAGENWPDGQPMEERFAGRTVIYVNGEGAEQLLKARLDGWEFDKSKLRLMMPRRGHMLDLTRQEDRDALLEGVAAARPALVIIDSLSTISSKGENNVEDVRDLLSWLSDLAAEFSCGLILIHHLRKRGALVVTEDVTLDDFRGSGHAMAAPKSVLALSLIQNRENPDPNGPRKLKQLKTNIGLQTPPLQVRLVSIDRYAARLEYSVLSEEDCRPRRGDSCASWLLDTLRAAGEPMAPKEILKLAAGTGFTQRMIYAARETLGDRIVDTHGRRHPKNQWKLAAAD